MTQAELETLIKRNQKLYYDGNPELEDYEFDELWDELRENYPDSPLLKEVGSDTVDADKFEHIQFMGSLEKITKYEEIDDWFRLKHIEFPVMVQEKLDGSSVSLVYEDGNLIRAVTRGDGHIGKLITDNVRLMSVPKTIPFHNLVAVRGEIVLPLSNISKLVNMETTNVRNMATGIANQKNGVDNLNLLKIVCYDVNLDLEENEKIKWLEQNGFDVPSYKFLCNNRKDLIDYIEMIHNVSQAGGFDWQIDGAVVKQNHRPENADTSKARPDWQRAFKYPVQHKTTILREVKYQRSGHFITPVAIFDPITLEDTRVSRASLANLGEMKRLGIKVPCEIEVSKRNLIIPKVEKVVSYLPESQDPYVPKHCSVCGEPLEVTDTYIKCSNVRCDSRLQHRIMKWLDTIGANGFGDALIEHLINSNITHINELYCNDLVSHAIGSYYSPKNAQKAFAELWAKSRNLNLYDFIAGFDLDGMGSKVVKLITDAGYDTLDKISKVNYDELIKINGFGQQRAELFIKQFKLIEDEMALTLNTNRVSIKTVETEKPEAPKSQLVFCITGKLSRPRAEYEAEIAAKGHRLATSVTGNVNYLVNNDIDSQSSKNKAAKEKGVPIITEEEFQRMLNG